jgi:hypothetical protein
MAGRNRKTTITAMIARNRRTPIASIQLPG